MSSLQFIENSDVGLHVVVYITEKLLCSFGCKMFFGFMAKQVFLTKDRRELSRVPGVNPKTCHDMPWVSPNPSLAELTTETWNMFWALSGLNFKWKSAVKYTKGGQTFEKRAINTWVQDVGCGFWVWIGPWRPLEFFFGQVLHRVFHTTC